MEEYLEEVEKKAGILIDALPYIRDFNEKIVVISYSCSNILEASMEQRVMKDIVLLKSLKMKPIVVHNTRMGADKFRENKRFAKLLELCGVKAVGICGIDLQTLHMMLENNYIPVVTPNDIDDEEIVLHPENTAMEIAVQMKAEKLVYLSEIAGIPISSEKDPSKIQPFVTLSQAEALYEEYKFQKAEENFLRKLRNGIRAVKENVARVHLLDGRIPHSLLLEFFSIDGVGTVLVKDQKHLYAHEITSCRYPIAE